MTRTSGTRSSIQARADGIRIRGVQIADQQLTRGNLALARSHMDGLPVRVIRGPRLRSPYAPARVYRYDGLYMVEDHWQERGRSGFLIWRFRLRRIAWQASIGTPPSPAAPLGTPAPQRSRVSTQRIVRNTAVTQWVKDLYDHRCQICGTRLQTPAGAYAEGAHIQPLGRPHNGPDVPENALCLCPNCHVLFDAGAVTLADDLTVQGAVGPLRVTSPHKIDSQYVRYHRERYGAAP
jgi:putative restriction endonuclease